MGRAHVPFVILSARINGGLPEVEGAAGGRGATSPPDADWRPLLCHGNDLDDAQFSYAVRTVGCKYVHGSDGTGGLIFHLMHVAAARSGR